MSISNFKKTNGMEVSDNVYNADVSYTLTFTKSADQVQQDLASGLRNATPMERMAAGMTLAALKMSMGGDWKTGDTRQVSNSYKLNKTEQGWRVAEG